MAYIFLDLEIISNTMIMQGQGQWNSMGLTTVWPKQNQIPIDMMIHLFTI